MQAANPKMSTTEHIASLCMEDRIKVHRVLVGKPEGKRPHGRY
jgi:hypothetical protein